MISRSNVLFVLLLAPALMHCTGNLESGIFGGSTPVDPNGATASLELDAVPSHSPLAVNEAFEVSVSMEIMAQRCSSNIDTGTSCSFPVTNATSMTITDASCDDDLCEIQQIDSSAQVITIVPKAPHVKLTVTGASGSLNATNTLTLDAVSRVQAPSNELTAAR